MRVSVPISPLRGSVVALLVAAAIWLLPAVAVPWRIAGTVLTLGLGTALLAVRPRRSGDAEDRGDAARDEVQAQAARMRSIVETATEGIIAIDTHGMIDTFNGAAERMFGYRAEEVIGRNVKLLMPDPDRRQHDGYLERYLTTGEKRIIGIGREVTGLRKDGTTFPVDLSVGDGSNGSRPFFTAVVRDIT